MTWEMLNLLAIIAFSFSGAIVALQEKYDMFGVYILGLAASFGGGIIRNILMGIPIKPIWEQGVLLYTALLAITIIYVLPKKWIYSWNRWNDFFDAVGLAAFTIQGAVFAVDLKLSLGAVILSSVVTGIGGGIVRDILARRKPAILYSEIYAVWAILVGVVIGLGWINKDSLIELYSLLIVVTVLRTLSIVYKWHLKLREFSN
ncbi:trimeric intracellular cation channel family protein [Aneurinibacillus terranovensis]|uniref:trimeric intracellular cation channel family protein n=1 Tax=Aneurinibacillus terranovensis TaxID=278991 RepID=UPI0004088D9F|nr:trimeric intracellular cation channel family protein [Aneurinibacillus terranovensis]